MKGRRWPMVVGIISMSLVLLAASPGQSLAGGRASLVVTHKSWKNTVVGLKVEGVIENKGWATAYNVKMNLVIKDFWGKYIGSTYTYPSPRTIAPGGFATFFEYFSVTVKPSVRIKITYNFEYDE